MAVVIKESKHALAEAQALILASVSNQTTEDITRADTSDVTVTVANNTLRTQTMRMQQT